MSTSRAIDTSNWVEEVVAVRCLLVSSGRFLQRLNAFLQRDKKVDKAICDPNECDAREQNEILTRRSINWIIATENISTSVVGWSIVRVYTRHHNIVRHCVYCTLNLLLL